MDVDPAAPPDCAIDLTDQVCPMTFVHTRLALDAMQPGQTLLILLAGEEPAMRVPATVRQLGHTVLDDSRAADGSSRLLVRKA